jgi:hypothetical protein
MFTLLLKTEYGWTDYLGHGDNEWSTEEAAWAAARSLEEVGFSADSDYEWRIISADDLSRYDLIA